MKNPRVEARFKLVSIREKLSELSKEMRKFESVFDEVAEKLKTAEETIFDIQYALKQPGVTIQDIASLVEEYNRCQP